VTAFVVDNSLAMRWVFDEAAHANANCILHSFYSFIGEAVVPDNTSH
jgi:hypothetical protein